MAKPKKKKQHRYLLLYILLGLIALGCLGVMLYPMISNLYSEQMQSKVQLNYEEVIEQVKEEDMSQYIQEAQLYNEMLAGNTSSVDNKQKQISITEYAEQMNATGYGIMGYVDIPIIKVYLPIYHGDSNEGLEKGVQHLFGTSLPIGGASTHAALSAHTGVSNNKLFTDLEELEIGDIFYIHALRQTLAYQVDQIKIVEPWDTSLLGITQGEDYVTLITCTPYAVNTHRLLVRGTRIPYTEAIVFEKEQAETREVTSQWSDMYIKGLLIGVIAAVIIVGIIIFIINITRLSKRNRGNK